MAYWQMIKLIRRSQVLGIEPVSPFRLTVLKCGLVPILLPNIKVKISDWTYAKGVPALRHNFQARKRRCVKGLGSCSGSHTYLLLCESQQVTARKFFCFFLHHHLVHDKVKGG